MASTFSTNLALELIGTGDQAGTWGITTNTNLGTLIEQAISGYVTQAVATGTDTTITIPDGATGVARNMYIELTGTGGASTNLIVPANKKLYFIFNNSTGAVTVKVSGQTGVSVPQGKKMVLVSNGTDIVNAANYVADFGSNSATITQLTSTSATITNLTTTSLTLSNNPVLNGGTANGVLYLNGSKVATSGSALTFDGTNFATTGKIGAGATAGLFMQMWSTGNIMAADGSQIGFLTTSAGAPANYMTGSAASNYLAWVANNAEQMRLTSTGLGIGTSSPSDRLHVSTSAQPIATFNSSAANGGYLSFARSATSIGYVGSAVTLGSGTNNDFGVRAESNLLFFTSGGYERARIDSSGNLGLGVTPFAWSGMRAMDIGDGAFAISADGAGAGDGSLTWNGYYNGSNWIYKSTAPASRFRLNESGAAWFTAPSGTAGNTISFTQAMTLDASGNLGVGITSPNSRLDVVGGTGIRVNEDGSSTKVIQVRSNFAGVGPAINVATNDPLLFQTNNTERARITSDGKFGLNTTTPQALLDLQTATGVNAIAMAAWPMLKWDTSDEIAFGGYTANQWQTIKFYTAATERARIDSTGRLLVNATAPAGGTDGQLYVAANAVSSRNLLALNNTDTGSTSAGVVAIYRNGTFTGGITNTNTATSFNTSSDRRLKENISQADDAGSVIDAIEIVKHDWKGGGHTRYGVIAQDLHKVAPEAVKVGDDGEEVTDTWGVDYSKLVPMLIKEVQSLRKRVAELEVK